MLFTCCYSDMVNGKLHAPHNCRSCVADSSNTSIPAQPAYSSYLQRSQVLRQVPLSLATHGRMTHFRHENWEKHADIYESYIDIYICVCVHTKYIQNKCKIWLIKNLEASWLDEKQWQIMKRLTLCVCENQKSAVHKQGQQDLLCNIPLCGGSGCCRLMCLYAFYRFAV